MIRGENMNQDLNRYNDLMYRTSKNGRWMKISKWMKFFLSIGEYIEKKEYVNIYISYIDEFYPALFITKGLIDANLNNLETKIKDYDINIDLKIGDRVAYLTEVKNDKEVWKKAQVIDIYYDDNALKDEWNPYIELQFEKKKKNELNYKIPKTKWSKRLRISSNYKSTAGSIIKMNREIEGYFKEKYSEELVDYFQAINKKQINIVGLKVQTEWENYNEYLQFLENNIQFKIKDFIFPNESKYSITNVNFIKTISSKNVAEKGIPTLFVGDNSALTLAKLKTKKNIIVSNRKKNNDVIIDLVKQNVVNDFEFENEQEKSDDLHKFLNEKDISIPKGVEVFVY